MNPTIEGELLSLSRDGFEGWAWDSDKPYDPVDIEIICNDVVIAVARADGFSLELVKQRKGNGMHLFHAKPDSLPVIRYPADICARIRGCTDLLPGSVRLTSPTEFLGILPEHHFQKFDGHLDGIRNGYLVGWVINTITPDTSIDVELLDGDRCLAAGRTNCSRPDIEALIEGGGRSGFELALPYSLLDGQMHNLRVRVVGTKFELRNSPLLFGLGSANALVNEVNRLREVLKNWDAREKELSQVLIARFEALYSIQRDSFEREIQAIKTTALGMPRRYEAEKPQGENAVEPVVAAFEKRSGAAAMKRENTKKAKPGLVEKNRQRKRG